MRANATLQLDEGLTLRVEVDRADLERAEITVRRTDPEPESGGGDLAAMLRAHLATAKPHPAGTTDRLLQEDRDRPY